MKQLSAFVVVAVVISCSFWPTPIRAEEKLVDVVVASVNDQPITLKDLSTKLRPARSLTMAEASQDPEARLLLDQLITDRLIEAEAVSRKISVGENDVAAYMTEVAQRNGMTLPELEAALKEENIEISQYRDSIKLDILKSRLAGVILRDGVSVTDKEVDDYVNLHPELVNSGSTVKLRQIVVPFSDEETEKKAQEKIQLAESRLRDGDEFAEVAHDLSEGAEASEGGLLGLVSEEELSSSISEVLSSLKEGEHSETVRAADGFRIFYLEERFKKDASENTDKLREEVRKSLEQEKTDSRLSTYFTVDLLKKHSVDKKI